MEQNQNENYLAILHPELMSQEQLLQELKQRKIEEPGQQSMGNTQLVDLFYRTVVPMPQRKYRLNRRGKVMTKRQILLAKRKRTHNQANAPNSETTTEVISIYSRGQERENSSGSRLLSSFNLQGSSVARDRLKPPPGASGGERKIIRLKSKSESASASSIATVSSTSDTSDKHISNLTKIVTHKEGQSTSVSKPIKIKRHNFDKKPEGAIDRKANDTVSSTTDVKTYTSNSRSDEKKKDANEEPVVKKFKKISITWP